ncbi:hypothetical protein BH23ACT8_BH23ACT8_10440 [soil metagenome]
MAGQRHEVDLVERRQLTGIRTSEAEHLLNKVVDASRCIATLRMRPMTLHELGASSDEVSLAALFNGEAPTGSGGADDLRGVLELLVSGGWPQQLRRPDRRFVVDYLEQTAHVDINGQAGSRGRRRRDPDKVRAFLRSLARNIVTPVGARTIATDTGPSRDAVTDYLDALQGLMIVEDQPAFNVHLRSSRNLRVTPNRHFVDPSLAVAALRTDAEGRRMMADLNYTGLLFESMVLRDVRVLAQPLDASVMYFHTDAHEIDIVVQRPGGEWGAVEVTLGGDSLIDQGANSLLAAVESIDLARAAGRSSWW